ncbi:hypothetical protein GALMADRAFT_253501 [Galerina marginata CBS 339.88]|uniref:FAD dependent oxidoreductase domain-containing protein n=1 Tax=Galerina marginata (strain CBS 339.88) TaxID=685588 RepID=A0A067SYA6_GALM3|nr:hypothetical protein GALMADRAFT_253501 [Galerina marginata CBS 339.88]
MRYPCQFVLNCIVLCSLASRTLVTASENGQLISAFPHDDVNPSRNSVVSSVNSQTLLGLENTQSVLQAPPFIPASRLRKRVSLPVEKPTQSFWLDTHGANPLAEEGSTGILTQDADVCVIGSGITGVSAAWHLSKILGKEEGLDSGESTSVVILEARQFCSGATGRNGGHLTRNVFSSFLARQAAHDTSEATKSYILEQYTSDALVRFVADRNLEEEVDLVEGGHVTVFRYKDEETEARENWEAAKAAGLDVDVKWIGQDELIEKYGLNRELNYTGVSHVGHNLWPCKLVTHLFKEAQSTAKNVNISLHTKTPVSAITRDFWPLSDDAQVLSATRRRRWKLHTARGSIRCAYVVHATNGYAAHLLPFLAGIEESSEEASSSSGPSNTGGSRPPPGEEHPPQPLPPHPHPRPQPSPLPRGMYGIVPTRGQVGAVRASVGPSELAWRNSWNGGDGGWEYWFPRYQDTNANSTNSTTQKKPLIILGGGRQFSGGKLEAGIADDSNVNPLVSKALRSFLPRFFPDQFVAPADNKKDEPLPTEDPWEMEWTGIMGFTKGGDPFVGPVVPPSSFEEGATHESNYEGQYIAAGYTGHGMPRAYACAEVVAGMISAQISGEPWTKPSWLPEWYLTWATHP